MHIHFNHPYWLFTIIPCSIFTIYKWIKQYKSYIQNNFYKDFSISNFTKRYNIIKKYRILSLLKILFIIIFIILGISGPSWKQNFVLHNNFISPIVFILDMSNYMLYKDILPNRLIQAKREIEKILDKEKYGKFALIVYTKKPFVLSSLTKDKKIIKLFLSMLEPSIMPIDGEDLNNAILEGKDIIKKSGLNYGILLVLTSTIPNLKVINTVKLLSLQNFNISIVPIISKYYLYPMFKLFATCGNGYILPIASNNYEVKNWILKINKTILNNQYIYKKIYYVKWKSVKTWFLIPALLLIIFIFIKDVISKIM